MSEDEERSKKFRGTMEIFSTIRRLKEGRKKSVRGLPMGSNGVEKPKGRALRDGLRVNEPDVYEGETKQEGGLKPPLHRKTDQE